MDCNGPNDANVNGLLDSLELLDLYCRNLLRGEGSCSIARVAIGADAGAVLLLLLLKNDEDGGAYCCCCFGEYC